MLAPVAVRSAGETSTTTCSSSSSRRSARRSSSPTPSRWSAAAATAAQGRRSRGRAARPGSPVRKQAEASRGVLTEAPVGRTVMFMLLGLIVFVWGLATITF